MIVYIDQKIITWKRFKYKVKVTSEDEVLEIMNKEFYSQDCEDTDDYEYIESETLDEYEEACSSNIDGFPSTEMIIVQGNLEKTIKQQ